MKYDQYVSLIQSLESYAATNRKAYEYKVLGLAMLGYGYFVGLILVFLAVPVAIGLLLLWAPGQLLRVAFLLGKVLWIFVPLVAAFFGFLGGAIKAMFAKVPAPEGRSLSRAEAPALFDFIETTCKTLKAKLPETILVTDEFNAAVATLPRFGMFGRQVYMLLGLPLMQALSPEQFKAVLAHEIGHISEKHGAFAKWAYQLREAWGRFIESQEVHEHKFAALYEKFVNWFFPYFTAYSFVLMREHEKDADRYSVQIVGAKPAGEALIALETQTARLNEVFWSKVHEENVAQPSAPKGIFSRMLAELAASDPEHEARTISRAVQVPTDYGDSHPSLSERLRLIGYWTGGGDPVAPPRSTANAAAYFLGEGVALLVRDFDIDWDEKVARDWRTRYEHFQKSQKRIAELDLRSEELTAEELIEKAGLIAEEKGNAEAIPLLQQIVQRFPEHAEANYFLGGALLSTDDESGLAHVKRAMHLDDKWRLAASDVAFQYLRSKGRLDEAREYAKNVEEEEETLSKAQAERQGVSVSDRFEQHSLESDVVEKIVSKLKYYDEIVAIYLVRKVVRYRPDIPFHIVFFDIKKPGRFKRGAVLGAEDILKIALERLDDGNISYFADLEKELAPIKAQLDAIDGARILER
jgi:Zn-dependent protease with chaperone function